jgi:hypothetical protein
MSSSSTSVTNQASGAHASFSPLGLPRLTLRVAFAGSKDVPENKADDIRSELFAVFNLMAKTLSEIASAQPQANRPPPISAFYSRNTPIIRLIAGLCEGCDSLSFRAMEAVRLVQTDFAAVIPFDLETYRQSRPAPFRREFDRQAEMCSYILPLDGIYDRPAPDTPESKNRRGRGYRAQSALLLRQADILVAAADPSSKGSAGGTMETVRAALEFNLPVIFYHIGAERFSIIEPGDDPATALAELQSGDADWESKVRAWVRTIVADPDETPAAVSNSEAERERLFGVELLTNFFGEVDGLKIRNGKRVPTIFHWAWNQFDRRFREEHAERDRAKASSPSKHSSPPSSEFTEWRKHSSELNGHFSGLYRGTFLVNYTLATAAVFLAALSLVVLGLPQMSSEIAGDKAIAHALRIALLPVAFVKLGCVFVIYRYAKKANDNRWNERAVYYRYLAERLRTMLYLPLLGSFQPPMAAPPQHAFRSVRQSAIDWLFDAIVRSISPASLPWASRKELTFETEAGPVRYETTIVQINPLDALDCIHRDWIKAQAKYHLDNSERMERMHEWAEKKAGALNVWVMWLVGIDLVGLGLEISGILPHELESLIKFASFGLVFFAAFLPTAVASLNGIRFQSECRRLAERSGVMRVILEGHSKGSSRNRGKDGLAQQLLDHIKREQKDKEGDPGSWIPEVLRFAESVAHVFVDEVSEWSILYAKEVAEP